MKEKLKKIYTTEKEDEVIVYYKDDATAFNGEKKRANRAERHIE